MIAMRLPPPLLVLCAIAAASAPARADYPVAPDVVVFCEPTLRPLVIALGMQWRDETGVPVRVFSAPTGANLAEVAHHTRDDVIIAEGDAAAARAAAQNLVKSTTVVRLWRNRLVAATLAGAVQKARESSPPEMLDLPSLAGKEIVAIVDPGVATAGDEGKQALQKLGLWEAISAKSIGVPDTSDAAFLLSTGKVRLAVLYASDVAARRDFAVTDTLPAGVAPIVYWAAETQRALSPNSAKFLSFLQRPEVRGRGRDAGLEVLP